VSLICPRPTLGEVCCERPASALCDRRLTELSNLILDVRFAEPIRVTHAGRRRLGYREPVSQVGRFLRQTAWGPRAGEREGRTAAGGS